MTMEGLEASVETEQPQEPESESADYEASSQGGDSDGGGDDGDEFSGVSESNIDGGAKKDPASHSDRPKREATKETAKPELITLRIDGQDVQVDMDELKRGYGTNKAATKAFQEASELRNGFKKFFEKLPENPQMIWDLAKQAGLDPVKLAKDMTWEQMQLAKMDPDERDEHLARRERDTRLKRFEEQERIREEQDKHNEMQALESEAADNAAGMIENAFKQLGIDPKNRMARAGMVAKIAEFQQNSYRANKRYLEPEQVTKLVRDQYRQDFDMLRELPVAELVEKGFLSEQLFNHIGQAYLNKTKDGRKLPPFGASKPASTPTRRQSPKKVGIDDWFRNI